MIKLGLHIPSLRDMKWWLLAHIMCHSGKDGKFDVVACTGSGSGADSDSLRSPTSSSSPRFEPICNVGDFHSSCSCSPAKISSESCLISPGCCKI
eukprot:4942763-Ditylum_brightwellii.AAC.1